MIVNIFPFFNELDLLEIRLAELCDVVDRFVIVEAPTTFTMIPKPLYYQENQARYAQWADKIHVYTTQLPGSGNAWINEYAMRTAFTPALRQLGLSGDAWVITTDADEIPRARAVQEAARQTHLDWLRIDIDFYYYTFNQRIGCPCSVSVMQYHTWKDGSDGTPPWNAHGSEAHGRRADCPLHIPDGGWHCSYFSDREGIQRKIQSFGHQEYNSDYWLNLERIQKMMDENVELYERSNSFPMWYVPIRPETHPAYFIQHMERFNQFVREDQHAV